MSRLLTVDELAPLHDCPRCALAVDLYQLPAETRDDLKTYCDELRAMEGSLANAHRLRHDAPAGTLRAALWTKQIDGVQAAMERARQRMRVLLGQEDAAAGDDLWDDGFTPAQRAYLGIGGADRRTA